MFFDIESCKKVQTKCANWKDRTNFRAEIYMFLKKRMLTSRLSDFFLNLFSVYGISIIRNSAFDECLPFNDV